MGTIVKGFFVVAFVALVYFGVDALMNVALNHGLPQLPNNVAYFISASGADVAIQIYISILTAGFVGKQTLAYVRTL